MPRIEVYWTNFAEKKLDDIFEYILQETYSREIALKVILSLVKNTDQLKKFRNSGNLEPLLKKFKQSHRYLIEGNYKIIYLYDGERRVIVIDVFHTRQNPVKISARKKRR